MRLLAAFGETTIAPTAPQSAMLDRGQAIHLPADTGKARREQSSQARRHHSAPVYARIMETIPSTAIANETSKLYVPSNGGASLYTSISPLMITIQSRLVMPIITAATISPA